jgi:hypothetical protein
MPVSRVFLSQSPYGRGIQISATSGSGDPIHTTAGTDDIYLWAVHDHSANIVLTIRWGHGSADADTIPITLPPNEGLFLVVPGMTLASGYNVSAIASVADQVNVFGYVNRIS